MYASQTKRLCVREAPADDTRAQHLSTSLSAGTTTGGVRDSGDNKHSMTASATSNLPGNGNDSPLGSSNTTRTTDQVSPLICSSHRDQTLDDDETSCNFEQRLIDHLANETLEEARLDLILSIRNFITACNKKKGSLVSNPNFTKILGIIDDEKHTSSEVKAQLALLLCSIAKGGERNVRILNDSFVDDKIYYLILGSQDEALIEACLRCMRAIMSWPRVSRHGVLYDNPKRIIDYARNNQSHIVQECIADIFAATCNRRRYQKLLFDSGAMPCILQLLESKSHRVILASLNWLSAMCFKHTEISLEFFNSCCPSGAMLLDKLVELMSKDQPIEFQFVSAKCFTRISKVLGKDYFENDSRIVLYVLPTLVRMVHKGRPAQIRSDAASTIASLIEDDTKLQETASICDSLIESLAHMLEFELSDSRDTSQLSDCIHEMKLSAFQALAALSSHQEAIRKKIFESCAIMQHIMVNLSDTDPRTLKSVLFCILSLSRSVQQLRTSFADNNVYNGLKNLLLTKSNDILKLVLMILCNISLDFSPGKQYFLDTATISILCNLATSHDPSLRLHSMWILMNMLYMLKDLGLKFQILRTITPGYVLNILETEKDDELLMKTLGFLRNLLSYRPHIDEIMNNHGESILQSLARLLERPCSPKIREQAICVLANIADGIEAKGMIMNNRALLKYLANTLCDDDAGDLRLAVICCITNLAHKDHEGSQSRQNEMKLLGIQDKLRSMLNTMDPTLSDRVRTAYNQFLLGVDDKY